MAASTAAPASKVIIVRSAWGMAVSRIARMANGATSASSADATMATRKRAIVAR